MGFGVLVFVIALLAGVASKNFLKPAWAKEYTVEWSDQIGRMVTDLSYGEEEAQKFDLYLPADTSKKSYGLVVYLHAGGFTSGDKKDDQQMLQWLASKGYVAAGINYTLRTDENGASVTSQAQEIKDSIPHVIEAAKNEGYTIDKMAISGGSAGHALAMIYAYRDAKEAPVPVVLTFGGVGPSSFYMEDWGIYGADTNHEAAAGLVSAMTGQEVTEEMIVDDSYKAIVNEISAVHWVTEETVPSVVIYGKHDKVQPYKGSLRLEEALKENGVDYQFITAEHSGHGLQNDYAANQKYMELVEEYLAKYMPVD
ncbi:alpha/beta hydrolase [Streptococcus suis]|uniref:alpha/beta hydrolase n=1 Tax=Streptococcus suis TaxID=1307 RepID=UPI001B7D877C|nr:alpha/beta hydrolase [Streptococcus suis]MCO8188009.1 alpha/beta hydrolase [Streptococcus suis]